MFLNSFLKVFSKEIQVLKSINVVKKDPTDSFLLQVTTEKLGVCPNKAFIFLYFILHAYNICNIQTWMNTENNGGVLIAFCIFSSVRLSTVTFFSCPGPHVPL